MTWNIKYLLFCLFFTWILAVFIGFIFHFLPRNDITGSAVIGFVDESESTLVNISYKTDIQNNGSLVVSDLPGLSAQIAMMYSMSHNMLRVFSARFIQSLILTRRKRQMISTNNDTSSNIISLFLIQLDIKHPLTCNSVKICNDRFVTGV
ncbi:hypothetical protein I4U23_027317 [Adineta vaga]|nr:hypothetical protein I4U23_027317 [Adineta vaga]